MLATRPVLITLASAVNSVTFVWYSELVIAVFPVHCELYCNNVAVFLKLFVEFTEHNINTDVIDVVLL